jgi:hypothetical protein
MGEELDILRAAQKEEQELVRQLESSPLYRKLQAVRQVIAAYGGEQTEKSTVPTPQPSKPRKRRVKPGDLIEETANAAEQVILEKGGPVPRGALYNAVVAKGISIKGKDPKNTLATRLYHSGRFRTIEGRGYVLKSMVLPGLNSETAGDGDSPAVSH